MKVHSALLWWLASSSIAVVKAQSNSVGATKSCFTTGQSITVRFTDADPQDGNWIGLVDSTANVFGGGVHYPQFVFTCGTPSCSGAPASGTVSIFNNLGAGTFKPVLLLADTFDPIVVGSNFNIRSTCSPTSPVRAPTSPVRTPTRRPTTRPVRAPTTKPVRAPQTTPVRPPTRRPSPPSFPPVRQPTGGIDLVAARQVLNQASSQFQAIIQRDSTMLPQLLRLLFHDCHGICDGCVDLSNPDNFRLDIPINALAPVISRFSNSGLSRADFWVNAMVTALNMANQGTANPVTFQMKWVGRKDCEDVSSTCINVSGQRVACSATTGGHRDIASVNMNTADFENFWRNEFNGMSVRQGIALIGCHTVGVLRSDVSGIDGPNGWLIDNVSFTNEYYQALLGSNARTTSTTQELLNVAPGWTQTFQDNSGTSPRIPDRNFWTLIAGGEKIVMTDADVCIARQMDSSNQDSNGKVSCAFKGNKNTCPFSSHIKIVQEFLDNDKWLAAVRDGLDVMTTNGYTRGNCNAELCELGP